MQSYQSAHMISKDDVSKFLENHLTNGTQQTKDIFDFLLIKHTKEIVMFFRKNASKYPNLTQNIDSLFNQGFSKQYILWSNFNQKIPDINKKYDYYKIINKPKDIKQPDLLALEQIFLNGDEQTIAELILKSVDILSQIQNIDFQNEQSKNDQNLVDNLQKFNILYDERIAITQYSNQCISANPNKIYDLLKNLIDNNVLKKIMSNFNFIQRFDYSDIEESLGDFICDEDIEFAYKDVLSTLLIPYQSIPLQTMQILDEINTDIIQQQSLLFAKFLTIISSSTHEVIFFDDSKLKIQCVQINQQLLQLHEQQFFTLKTIIFDIFIQNKELLNQLLSITSPEIILQLSIEFYPHIDLPQLLMLRTYQDGPQFINQFLLLATKDISKIQYELVYFILEFATKIIWLYDESPVFQSVSCQNTSKLLENFVTDANDHFGCNLLDTKLLSNVHPLIQNPVQHIITFIRQYNFEAQLVQQYLFDTIKDENQINVDLILQEVIVKASFIIADFQEQINIRAKFFTLLIQMLDKYSIFMSSTIQTTYFMKESGWHQIVLLNIIKAIQNFNSADENEIVLYILFLECQSVKNKPYLLNIMSDISQTVQKPQDAILDLAQFNQIVNRNFPTSKIIKDIKLTLNQIVPLTAFNLGCELSSDYSQYSEYIITFVILDRLIVDQDKSILSFIEGFSGQKNVAKYLLNSHIIPIFNYIFPRFTLLRFTFSNDIEVINQSPMLYDSSDISFRYPKSHNSLISIEINQIAKIASFLVQNIEVDSSIDYLVQNLIYYHSFAIDMINGIYFQKYTEFIRVFLQPIFDSNKQQLVKLLDNSSKLCYFITQLFNLKKHLIDQVNLDQAIRDFKIILDKNQFQCQYFSDSLIQILFQYPMLCNNQIIQQEFFYRTNSINTELKIQLIRDNQTLMQQVIQFFSMQSYQNLNLLLVGHSIGKINYFIIMIQQFYSMFNHSLFDHEKTTLNASIKKIMDDLIQQ